MCCRLLHSRHFTPEEDWDGNEREVSPTPWSFQARL